MLASRVARNAMPFELRRSLTTNPRIRQRWQRGTWHRLISNVATGRQTPGRIVSSVDEIGLTKTLVSITRSVSGVGIAIRPALAA